MNEKKTRPAVSGADLLVSNDRGMMDPPGHNPGPPVLTDVLVDGVPAKAGIGVFGTWSERIVLFFENEHPKYGKEWGTKYYICLLYTSPSPRDRQKSRMPSSA